MITHDEVVGTLGRHDGTATFDRAIRAANTPLRLLWVLSLYAEFNADAGVGIAALAAQVALQRHLFVDRDDPAFPDRSYEVAAPIFNAAVDEFGGRSRKRPVTHRSLARQLVLGAARFFSIEPPVLAGMMRTGRSLIDVPLTELRRGYGIGHHFDVDSLFRSIGFHIGQELCGDEEYHALDGAMRRHHAEVLDHLEKHRLAAWISVHLQVESGHIEQALLGANRALQYCADERGELLKLRVLEGVEAFASVQSAFMRQLAAHEPATD